MCLIASTESREGLGAREPQGKGLPQYPHAEDPMESLQDHAVQGLHLSLDQASQ